MFYLFVCYPNNWKSSKPSKPGVFFIFFQIVQPYYKANGNNLKRAKYRVIHVCHHAQHIRSHTVHTLSLSLAQLSSISLHPGADGDIVWTLTQGFLAFLQVLRFSSRRSERVPAPSTRNILTNQLFIAGPVAARSLLNGSGMLIKLKSTKTPTSSRKILWKI